MMEHSKAGFTFIQKATFTGHRMTHSFQELQSGTQYTATNDNVQMRQVIGQLQAKFYLLFLEKIYKII